MSHTYSREIRTIGVCEWRISRGGQKTRQDCARAQVLGKKCDGVAVHFRGGDNDFNYESHTLLIQTFARSQ